MRYQILYQPSYSLAVVQLEQGEAIMAESGAMVSMSPTVRLEAKMSGGGLMGALGIGHLAPAAADIDPAQM